MSTFQHLLPRQAVPQLRLPLAGGGTVDLSQSRPERFTLVLFYRGHHCPICKTQLEELERKLPELASRGVSVIAVSADSQERAERSKAEWKIAGVPLAFGLTLDRAREWGLYLSSGRGADEPAVFSEPGLFLVRADGTLYFSSVQTMPFARPRLADVVGALDVIIERDYPARGELAGVPPTGVGSGHAVHA